MPLRDWEKYQYLLKFIESNGQPSVGISTFYANNGRWNPSKEFCMSREEWKWFIGAVVQIDEDVQGGAPLI